MQYPATFTPDSDGSFLVQFSDIPEAITSGSTHAEALEMAQDALLTALEFYVEDGRALPSPSAMSANTVAVELDLMAELKIRLHNEMMAKNIRQADLARLLGIPYQRIGRLLDPRQTTKLDLVSAAFKALGKRIDVQLADAMM